MVDQSGNLLRPPANTVVQQAFQIRILPREAIRKGDNVRGPRTQGKRKANCRVGTVSDGCYYLALVLPAVAIRAMMDANAVALGQARNFRKQVHHTGCQEKLSRFKRFAALGFKRKPRSEERRV